MNIRLSAFSPALAFLLAAGSATAAHAEFKMFYPVVESGEVEFEHAGSLGLDHRSDHNREGSMINAIGYGVNDHWFTEVEGEWTRDAGPGNYSHFDSTNWENIFQLFDQGSQWMDVGLFAEYGRHAVADDADHIKMGPLLQKSIGPTTTTVNLFLEKQVGPHSTSIYDGTYAAQLRYDWTKLVAPALEIYGDVGDIRHVSSFNSQQQRLGPVLTGEASFGRAGELRYEIGYLLGTTAGTPQHTVKWLLEYEVTF